MTKARDIADGTGGIDTTGFLTSSDLTGYLTDQSTLDPSKLDTNVSLPALDGSALTGIAAGGGKVLQAVSATYSTAVSSTNPTSWTDTGLTLSITPSSADSKILFIISQQANVTRASSLGRGRFQVMRDSTVVFDSASHTIALQQTGSDMSHSTMLSFSGLDSPSTTSAVTFKTQMLPDTGTAIKAQQNNHPSTITLLEIAA